MKTMAPKTMGGIIDHKHSLETGFSFGITSGIITTLGLIVGLNAGTGSRSAVIGGIMTIAVADAFSDALGIHTSEESEKKHDEKEIWLSTLATFVAKFIVALTFIVPTLLFALPTAITISLIWGLSLLSVFSFYLSVGQQISPWRVIGEHLVIAIVVIGASHIIGEFISSYFG